MLTTQELAGWFSRGARFEDYLAQARPHERPGWEASYKRVQLSEPQRALVAGFARRVNVLVLSGTWCGDCVQQCPMLARIAAAGAVKPGDSAGRPGVDLRFLEREDNLELADALRICGGRRVPTVVFLNEDFEFVSILGDRTLSRYRALASAQLGPSCPMPGAPLPPDQHAASIADWLGEFERVALLLRLSPRLREKHGD